MVLVRHMLGGIIKGDEKIYKLDFRLLRKRAVAEGMRWYEVV